MYLRDTGILHALLQIGTNLDLRAHPELGASWEGFALEQVIALFGTRDAYFWATHGGAELDLMIIAGGRRFGFEFKYADAPGRTRSLSTARGDLSLSRAWIIYPGDRAYDLDDTLSVIPLAAVARLAEEFRGP